MMTRKKLIIVSKCFDSDVSGPSNIVRGLMAELDRENIPYEAVLWKENISKLAFIKKLVRTLKNEKAAAVSVHTDGYLIPLLVYFCSMLFTRHTYYLTVHGVYRIGARLLSRKEHKYRYDFIEGYLYRHFPNIICVSEMLKNNIGELFGRSKNIRVIPNATDAASTAEYRKTDRIEIVSMCGLRKIKGIENVLAVAAAAKEAHLNWHFSVYGHEDAYTDRFRESVLKNNLEDIIEYKGMLRDKQQVYDRIAQADAQFCLSVYDTFNVSIAESLVLGCPCIASDTCGAAYLIDNGFNGLTVNTQQEHANKYAGIADYILSLNEEKRKDIQNEAIKYKDLLSWKSIAGQYADLT